MAASPEDERLFLQFLRSTAEIALIEAFAPTRDGLWVDSFAEEWRGHWKYLVWNRAFSWVPTYGQVGEQAHDPSQIGWWYVANGSGAPVLEFSRSDLERGRCGRLYWLGAASGREGPGYDETAFAEWFEQIVRWVRKTGKKRVKGAYEPYFLPDAWSHQAETQLGGQPNEIPTKPG